jgi:hypothetical protein
MVSEVVTTAATIQIRVTGASTGKILTLDIIINHVIRAGLALRAVIMTQRHSETA